MAQSAMDDPTVTERVRRHRERKKRLKARRARYWSRHKNRLIGARREKAFTDYAGLVDALVRRRKQLGWTQGALDDRCGFGQGHCSHLETFDGKNGRVATAVTLNKWLEALGLGFLAVPMVDGSIAEQAEALSLVDRPKINGAELNRRPRR